MKRAHLVVTGRVQGVLFRRYVREMARELGITGWVKNTLDGDVEIICEGKEKNLVSFISLIHKGPPMARVKEVKVEYEECKSKEDDFTIREFGF
ncbi:MAG: acylphosphatase [Patescibacteria group bacterium]|nr:acylphosphatase [Patescibacteria group bacterium]